jgi:CHASE2 domain-containing sensor protein
MTWKMILSVIEYAVLFAVLFFACYLSWSSRRTPLHLLWMVPVGCVVFVAALSLLQPG